jgi:hypothetical protein
MARPVRRFGAAGAGAGVVGWPPVRGVVLLDRSTLSGSRGWPAGRGSGVLTAVSVPPGVVRRRWFVRQCADLA